MQQLGDGGGELVGLDRLEQPAVDAEAAERLFVAGVRRGGEHEDGRIGRDVQLAGTYQTGHVRQAHVEKHGVRLQLADEVLGVLAGARRVHGVSGLREGLVQEEGGHGRILDDHDAGVS